MNSNDIVIVPQKHKDALRALLKALTDIEPFDYEQGRCYWCEGGWEKMTKADAIKFAQEHNDPKEVARLKAAVRVRLDEIIDVYTERHKDKCPFAAAKLLAADPIVEDNEE